MGQSILEQENLIGQRHKFRQESLMRSSLCDGRGVAKGPDANRVTMTVALDSKTEIVLNCLTLLMETYCI